MKRKDKPNLPTEVQIAKQKSKIKFLLVFGLIWNIFVIAGSLLIWVLTSEWGLAAGLLISVPMSLFLGGHLQIKECKEKIKALEKELDARRLDVADE